MTVAGDIWISGRSLRRVGESSWSWNTHSDTKAAIAAPTHAARSHVVLLSSTIYNNLEPISPLRLAAPRIWNPSDCLSSGHHRLTSWICAGHTGVATNSVAAPIRPIVDADGFSERLKTSEAIISSDGQSVRRGPSLSTGQPPHTILPVAWPGSPQHITISCRSVCHSCHGQAGENILVAHTKCCHRRDRKHFSCGPPMFFLNGRKE